MNFNYFKKTTLCFAFAAAITSCLPFISCSNGNDSSDPQISGAANGSGAGNASGGATGADEASNILDLRNKIPSSTRSLTRSVQDNIEETSEPSKININTYNGTTFSKSPFTLRKDSKGVKVIYTKPSEYAAGKAPNITYLCLCYLDGNGNASTREILNYEVCNNGEYSKDSIEFIFPTTVEGKTSDYYARVEYRDGAKYEAVYKITSGGGIGIIDDLPKNFEANGKSFSAQHINFENSKFTVVNTLYPEQTISYKLCVVFTTNTSPDNLEEDNYYKWNTTNAPTWITEMKDSFDSSNQYSIDLAAKINDPSLYIENSDNRNKEYFFVQFNYVYTVEGCDALFRTPSITSKIYKNTVFPNTNN